MTVDTRTTVVTQQPSPPVPAGPWAFPAVGVPGALCATLLLQVTPVPVWSVLAVLGTGAGVTLIVRRDRARAWFEAACWLFPAVWATVNAVFVHWAPWWLIVLVCANVAAALLSQALVPAPPIAIPVTPTPLGPAEHPKAGQLRRSLDMLLGLAPLKSCRVTRFSTWKGEAGYTAEVEMPPGSRVTLRRIRDVVEDLSAELRLPKGCTISVGPSGHHAAFVLNVELVDRLAKPAPFPTPYKPRSILDFFPLGVYADGSEALIEAYQASSLFVGRRGSGKTVLLHDFIAMVAQMTDALIGVIDLNSANLAVPWMLPYAQDEVDTPPLDFVAPDAKTAVALAEMLLDIAKDRKRYYASLTAKANADILPVSAKLPAIIVVVDEGGEVFGDGADRLARRAAEKLLELQRIGRAVCIQVVFTTQRGTISYLPSDLKKGTITRAVGMVDGDDEIAHVLDWQRGLTVADLGQPGNWYLRVRDGEPPRKMRTYHLLPRQIRDIVLATQKWRPSLDERGQLVGGRVYRERFDMIRGWLRTIAGYPADDDPATDDTGRDDYGVSAAAAELVAQQMMARIQRDLAGVRGEPAADPTPGEQVGSADTLDGMATDANLTDGAMLTLAYIQQSGPDGARTMAIFEAARANDYTDRRATVSDWINQLRERGWVTAHPVTFATWTATDEGMRVEVTPAAAAMAASAIRGEQDQAAAA